MKYFNIQRVLHLKDADGLEPSVFIITNNRSAGKTTSYLKMITEEFLNKGREFVLIFRTTGESESANLLFGDVHEMYFPDIIETEIKKEAHGVFNIIKFRIGDEFYNAGYSISLKNADRLKKYSPVFRKVYNIIMDEYQLENESYLKNELTLLESVVYTISRGGGEQSRKTRLMLFGNPYTAMNPYYAKYKIHERLNSRTKVLKGKGWVADFQINESAQKAIENNAHSKAFNSSYTEHAIKGSYMKEEDGKIKKKSGHYVPVLYFTQDNKAFLISRNSAFLYVNEADSYDNDFNIYTRSPSEANDMVFYLDRTSHIFKNLKKMFNDNLIYYDSMISKEFFFKFLFDC